MTTEDLCARCGFVPAFDLPAPARQVTGGFCGDLLSWAMGRAGEGSAWCTVMGNVNAVAVASLADVAAIILCEGAALDAGAADKANEQGVNIFSTDMPAFQAGLAVAKAAGFDGL